MTAIMQYSVEVAEAFREELYRIAYSPTARESEEMLHEEAMEVLEKYGWKSDKGE